MESNEMRVCQCHCVPKLSQGVVRISPFSFKSWIKLSLKRNLQFLNKRKLKRQSGALLQSMPFRRENPESPAMLTNHTVGLLKAGDVVRVRPEEEIRSTLNVWRELKGCMFMDAQVRYCGTVQKVLKPVERFVDERDYKVKRAKGLILLDGLICEGTQDYGRCDRACFYFWREEWLEKVD